MTASGDQASYLSMTYSALANLGCDVDHLALFPQPNRTVEEAIGAADVVWVGGGSVANIEALMNGPEPVPDFASAARRKRRARHHWTPEETT